MPKAYLIVILEDITDPEGFAKYREAAMPTIPQYQIKPLVMAENPKAVEGNLKAASIAVMEFESIEAARKWYGSAEYGAAIPLRQNAAKATLFLLEGMEMPS